jgi:hypothetical protein
MNINLTFIIQIVHFWVAYEALSRFLLKPFVHEYFKKKQIKAAVLENMQKQERELSALVEEKNRALVEFKETVKARYMPVESSIDVQAEMPKVEPSVTVNLDGAIQESAEFIAQKVIDAYRD